MDKKEYSELVEQTSPRTNEGKTLLFAFAIGGLICTIGQGVSDALAALIPSFDTKKIGALTGVVMMGLPILWFRPQWSIIKRA